MILGLDFGTSTTAFSTAAGPFPLGLDIFIPSVAMCDQATNSWVFGTEVYKADNPGPVITNLKSAITHYETVITSTDGRQSYDADFVITKFLSHLAQRVVREDQRESPEVRVRMSCPAFWDKDQRLRLLNCAAQAGFIVEGNVLLDEPIAAAVGWLESFDTIKSAHFGKRVLVFDMGGGTLDLAVLAIDKKENTQQEAMYQVLSANGSNIAGNAVDQKISAIVYEKLPRNSSQRQMVDANGGANYFLSHARDIKEALSESEFVSWSIPLPSSEDMTFEFSADELQALIVEVFENGPETVQASIELALRLSAVAALGSEATLGDFYRYSIGELASSIDELLLVGGMARMPALKKYVTSIFSDIFQARVPAQFPESDAGVQEVVSLGLGLPANYSNLNMMRPDFDIVLRIYDARRDLELGRYIIWDAYSKQFDTVFNPAKPAGFLGMTKFFTVPTPDGYSREQVAGEILVISHDGKPLEVEVRDLQGLRIETESQLGVNSKKFGFREDVEAVIVMNPSGFFRITDEQSKVTKGQLQVWPLPLIVMTNENYQADRGNRSNGSDETG